MSARLTVAEVGDWLIIRNWSLEMRQVAKVTPRLFKLGAGSSRYPTQIQRDERKIVCVVPTREMAEKLMQSIGGIDGEYVRRCRAANEERSKRVIAAREARDQSISKAIAALSLATPSTDLGRAL